MKDQIKYTPTSNKKMGIFTKKYTPPKQQNTKLFTKNQTLHKKNTHHQTAKYKTFHKNRPKTLKTLKKSMNFRSENIYKWLF